MRPHGSATGSAVLRTSQIGAPHGANPKAIQEVMGRSKIQTTYDVYGRLIAKRQMPEIWLHNRKRPSGEEGRFWGYYREERYVSLYMWIRGR